MLDSLLTGEHQLLSSVALLPGLGAGEDASLVHVEVVVVLLVAELVLDVGMAHHVEANEGREDFAVARHLACLVGEEAEALWREAAVRQHHGGDAELEPTDAGGLAALRLLETVLPQSGSDGLLLPGDVVRVQ